MMPKRQPTIRTRLLRALMLMTLLTLGMETILSAIMDLQLMRQHMLRDLQVLEEVVGKNCVSALVFDNPETARRHLSTLDREYQIRRALLYDTVGREFARWQTEPSAMQDPGHVPPGAEGLRRLLDDRVLVSHTIDFDGRPVGRIVIEARLDELYRHLRQYFLFAGALAVLTLAAAWRSPSGCKDGSAHPFSRWHGRASKFPSRRCSPIASPTPWPERNSPPWWTGLTPFWT